MEPREVGDFDTSAIDGISKKARNFREGNMGMGGTVYTPSEQGIRSDISELLEKDKDEFLQWLEPRIEAVEEELSRYELICSIPNLSYGAETHKYDMAANTGFKNHLEVLREGKTYLKSLERKWESLHGVDLGIEW